MIKFFEYTVDTEKKIIYLPPPQGAPRFLMVQARDYCFKQQFGDQYKRVILSGESWSHHTQLNEIKKIPAIAVKKLEDK